MNRRCQGITLQLACIIVFKFCATEKDDDRADVAGVDSTIVSDAQNDPALRCSQRATESSLKAGTLY